MLRFHPLADLFPLIEGVEFDDLVKSIKDNGQHDPIVLLDEMILDGRNRYRACLTSGVEPRIEQFTGKDAVAFVMDHNIHRRHLNESQRAMIAAKLANLKTGQRADYANKSTGVAKATPAMSASKAADMLNVNRATVVSAKTVLSEGTAEEIKAVEQGQATVTTIARDIRAKRTPKERKERRENQSEVGKNPQRIQNQRVNAQVWGSVRDALQAISSLPLPVDVVAIVRTHDRTGLVDARLSQSVQWLKEFADAWRDRDQAAA